jgi:hypothetical protein
LDEESKGSEFRLGNNPGSSEMIRRIGSLRNFNADSHRQEGNLNLQVRDDTETQSIRDQLNQYDEEEDNYYNDADVDEDEVEEGKEVTPSNVSLSH